MSNILVFENRNTFEKYFSIFLEKIVQAYKQNKEYKMNLYSVIIADIFVFIAYIIYYKIYGSLVFSFLSWNYYDFIIFFFLILTSTKALWIFSLKNFSDSLIKGELNSYLNKPVNVFYYFSLNSFSGGTLVTYPISLLVLLGLLFFSKYSLILGIFLLFIGTIYYVTFVNFFESLAFFIKKNNFLLNLFYRIAFINEKFTPKVFENSIFKNFFYLLPTALFGYITIEVLKGHYLILKYYSFAMIFIFLMLNLFTYILWHYGLKRYEAFG